MSSIKSVTPNLQSNSLQRQKKVQSTPVFVGNPNGLSDEAFKIIRDSVEHKIDNRMGVLGKAYKWLADTAGETQTQLINAIFTSTLAPAFIAFNPLSKQDEKTKKYTALRQPISAVIAVTGGLAMTMANDHYMDIMYNEGYNKSIDLRAKPSKDYLKYQFKKENKIWSPFLSSARKAELATYVKKVQAERQELFARLLTVDPKTSKIEVNEANSILIDGKEIRSIIKTKDKNGVEIISEGDVIGKNIPGLSKTAELTEYLNNNNLHIKTFGDFLKEEFHFEFFDDKSIKLDDASKKLREVKAADVLHAMGLIDKNKVNPDDLVRVISTIHQEKEAKRIQETLAKKGIFRDLEDILLELVSGAKLSSRNSQAVRGEDLGRVHLMSLSQFLYRFGFLEDGSLKEEFYKKPMHDVIETLKGTLGERLKGFKKDIAPVDIVKNMLDRSMKTLEVNAKNYKTITGIFFNLFSTAITCTVLNWAYPRIVEAFWPHLVKDDHKGGNK